MDESTRSGTRLLFEAYTEHRDDGVLRVVQGFTARQRANLGDVVDALPPDAQDEAAASLELVSDLHLRATQLLAVGTCGDDCAAVTPVAPSPGATTAPTPTASPTFDDLGPVPCACPGEPSGQPQPQPTPEPTPSAEPTPSETEPTPTEEPTPSPTSTSPTPSPTSTRYPVPSPVPTPIASPIQDIVEEVEDVLGTPLPTPPVVPGVTAPLAPGLPAAPKP